MNPPICELFANSGKRSELGSNSDRTGLRTATPLASPNTPAEQIFAAIPLTGKRSLCRELHERTWIIIQQRFGLEQTEQCTLEVISKKLHITRERTWQREKEVLRVLQDIFLRQNYFGSRYHTHRWTNADPPICTTSGLRMKRPDNDRFSGCCSKFTTSRGPA